MFHGACQSFFNILYTFFLIKNVPFKRMNMHDILYNATLTDEGKFCESVK